VASTKTFTATVTAAYLFRCLGLQRSFLTPRDGQKRLRSSRASRLMAEALEGQAEVAALAIELAAHSNFLFLGRGLHHPSRSKGAQAQGDLLHPRRGYAAAR